MTIIKGEKKGSKQARKPKIARDSAQSKTYMKILYGLSEGEIAGLANGNQSIYLEGTPLLDTNNKENFSDIKVNYRPGTNDQTYIEGFPAVESETAIDVELTDKTPWVKAFKNLELDAVRVRLKWGALFNQNMSNGDVDGYTIEYAMDLQVDGGAWAEVLKTKISDKTSANYERPHRIDLPRADKGWQIRVRRITPNRNADDVSDKMYIAAITEIIDVKLRYPNTALLGLQYDAETFSNVAKFATECKGRIIKVPSNYNAVSRKYDGIWDGTFIEAYTNNPAWIYYDICLNDRYGLGDRLTPFMIDKWSIYRLAQYCDQLVSDGQGGEEPRFTCNVYLQSAEDAYSTLSKLAGLFRAISYWDGNSIVCDADIPQDTYFAYSRANVIDGVFEYTGTRARDRHNVVKAAWDNPANHYKTEYEYVRDENAIAEMGQVRILDLEAWGCTSRGQAQRAGLWALKSEQVETRTVTFKVGLDGHLPAPGRIIEISDELFAGRANGGRVAAVSKDQKSVTLDRDKVVVKAGDKLVVNGEDGKAQTRVVQSAKGRVVTVTEAFKNIAVQNVWVLDAKDLATMKFRVISIAPEEKHQFTITALQHSPTKFEEIDNGTYFEDIPNSIINPTIQEPVANVEISQLSRVEQGLTVTTMVIAWPQAKGAVKYQIEWRKNDGSWLKLPITGNNSVEVPGVYAGNYQARVTAISAFEVPSLPVYSVLTELKGKQGLPPKLATIKATGILFGMQLDWTFPKTGALDTAYTEIEVSPDGKSNIAQLGRFAYPTSTTTIQGLQGNLTQHYRGRLIDRIGNIGAWSQWVEGTTSADPEEILKIIEGEIGSGVFDPKTKEQLEQINKNAQSIAAESKARAEADAAESKARADAIAAEVQRNTKALTEAAQKEAIAREKAINSKADEINKSISSVSKAVTQEVNDRRIAVKAESDARISAVSKLEDGLTVERSERKNEDASLLKNIETYKASTNNTLASVQNQITVNANNISAQASKTTALDGRVSATEKGMAKKLDASVIDKYSTTVETDKAIAERINAYNASLSLGGTNMAYGTDSDVFIPYIATGADSTIRYFDAYPTRLARVDFKSLPIMGLITPHELRQTQLITGKTYTLSFLGQGTMPVLNYNYIIVEGSTNFRLPNITLGAGNNNLRSLTFTWTEPATTTAGILLAASGKAGDWFNVRGIMLEEATKPSSWSPNPKEVQSSLDTNASAIQSTQNEVKKLDGRVTSNSSSITGLKNDMSVVKNDVSKKADGSAVSAIKSTVELHDKTLTSHGSSLNELKNSIDTLQRDNLLVENKDQVVTGAVYQQAIVATKEPLNLKQGDSITVRGKLSFEHPNELAVNQGLALYLDASQRLGTPLLFKQGNDQTFEVTTRMPNDKTFSSFRLYFLQNGTAVASTKTTLHWVELYRGESLIGTKADSTAFNGLKNEVKEIDGKVSTNSSAITRVEGKITEVDTKAGTALKNAASAQTTANSAVDQANANASNITKLQGSIADKPNNVIKTSVFEDGERRSWQGAQIRVIDITTHPTYKKGITGRPGTYNWEENIQPAQAGDVFDLKAFCDFTGTTVTAGRVGIVGLRFWNKDMTSLGFNGINFQFNDGTGYKTAMVTAPVNTAFIQPFFYHDGAGSTTAFTDLTITKRTAIEEANAAGISAITIRVSKTEDKFESQSTSMTKLQNDLEVTKNNVTKKVDSSAHNALDSKVNSVDGRVSANTSAITNLGGRLSTTEKGLDKKLDASVIDKYSTTVETDKAIAERINAYDVNLKLGGTNLLYGTDNRGLIAYTSAAANARLSWSDADPTEMVRVDYNGQNTMGVITSRELRKTTLIKGRKYILSFLGQGTMPVLNYNYIIIEGDANVRLDTLPLGPGGSTQRTIAFEWTGETTAAAGVLLGFGGAKAGDWFSVRSLMLEEATKASSTWSPNPVEVKSSLDANAKAITDTRASVTAVEDRIDSVSSNVTRLENRVGKSEEALSTKADSSTMNALKNQVVQQGKDIQLNGNSITDLKAKLDQGLNTKADSSAHNALKNEVTLIDGRVKTNSSAITRVDGRISSVEGQMAQKVDASVLNQYSTKTETNKAIAEGITSYKANLKLGGTNLIYGSNSRGLTAFVSANANARLSWIAEDPTEMVRADYNGQPVIAIMTPVQLQLTKLTKGKTYTLSFLGQGTMPVLNYNYIVDQKNGNVRLPSLDLGPGGATQRILTFTWDSETTSSAGILLGVSGAAAGQWFSVRSLMLEEATIPSAWSPNPQEVKEALEANATANQATQAEVKKVDGKLTAQTTQINNLQAQMGATNANIANNYYTKAEANSAIASASTTLESKVNKTTDEKIEQAQGKTIILDLTKLDNETYYPVTTWLPPAGNKRHRFTLIRYLTEFESINQVYWSTHASKTFSVELTWEVAADGWGANHTDRKIFSSQYAWTGWSPVLGPEQMVRSSEEVVYLRGGALYRFICDPKLTPTVRTEPYTVEGITVRPISYNADMVPDSDVGKLSVKISEQSTVIDGVKAVKSVTVDNNGMLSGWGILSELVDGKVNSMIGFKADQIYFESPVDGRKPFIVLTEPREINGTLYPAGTWIDAAYIAQATIKNAHIQDGAISNAKIQDAAIDNAKIGDLQVDTIKIKDNAVTVPVGVNFANKVCPNGPLWPKNTDYWDQFNEWVDFFGELGSIKFNKSGGKVRLDASFIFKENVGSSLWALEGNNSALPAAERYNMRMIVAIYKDGVLIGHTNIAPVNTVGDGPVLFSGGVSLVSIIDSTGDVGEVTYSLRFGFGYLGSRKKGGKVALTSQNAAFELNDIRMSLMELKK